MKAHLVILIGLYSLPVVAAEFPAATGRIADCENRWLLLETRDPTSRALGFAYVDRTAGVTVELNGDVGIAADGSLERRPFDLQDKARFLVRVSTNFLVACLAEDQLARLGLPARPEWLDIYKDSRAAGPHHATWAFHYNHIGAFDRALKHVEAARSVRYESRDLTFEHGFALNATERYEEALTILEPGVKAYPRDANIRAELAYSHLGLRNFPKAIEIYERAYNMDRKGESGRRAEFAQNIAAAYAQLGNDSEVTKWLELAEAAKPKKEEGL